MNTSRDRAFAQSDIPKLAPLGDPSARGRSPEWSFERFVGRACPVCGSGESEPTCVRPDSARVVRCVRCRMVYVDPAPSDEDLKRFYTNYADYKWPTSGRWSSRLLSRLVPNAQISVLEQTGGLRGMAVCEVGCSDGHFLELCRRRGANVYGVEWDESARRELARKGIPCSEELPTNRTFDIICGFQVLEHLRHPNTLLARISSSLGNGGRFLLSVPNGGEIDRVGPRWIGFRVDLEHLNYFSAATVSRLLGAGDIFVEYYWEHGQPAIGSSPGSLLNRGIRLLLPTRGVSLENGRFVLTVLGRKSGS